jgi:shikimate kinase
MIRANIGLDGSMDEPISIEGLRSGLSQRSIVLIGLMGCGKSSVGKRLANKLGLPFVDADEEIERVADKTIVEIFADHGEDYFRSGERRVIARLLGAGPQVLATGGGAFINPETRANIKDCGISVWLRADLPILMRRVSKRETRPLLKTTDPEAVMRDLIAARYPIYAEADITIESRDVPHDTIVTEVLAALRQRLALTEASSVS